MRTVARSVTSRSDVVEMESIELKEDSDETELTDARLVRSVAGGSIRSCSVGDLGLLLSPWLIDSGRPVVLGLVTGLGL